MISNNVVEDGACLRIKSIFAYTFSCPNLYLSKDYKSDYSTTSLPVKAVKLRARPIEVWPYFGY